MIAKQMHYWNTILMVPQGGNIIILYLSSSVPKTMCKSTSYEGYFGITIKASKGNLRSNGMVGP
jgi:hypothetical protein